MSEKCGFPTWSFLKSVLIFHHWDFYGTDSIPDFKKNAVDVILFFKYNCSYYVQKDELCIDKLPHFTGLRWTLASLSCGKDVTHRRRLWMSFEEDADL